MTEAEAGAVTGENQQSGGSDTPLPKRDDGSIRNRFRRGERRSEIALRQAISMKQSTTPRAFSERVDARHAGQGWMTFSILIFARPYRPSSNSISLNPYFR